jgi:hypothetical protein
VGAVNFDAGSVAFTAKMAKRTAPGPFATAPVCQGDWNTTDGNADQVTLARGTQISGNFYPNWDSDQGSINLWYTPEHGGDSKEHYLLHWSANGYLKINTSDELELSVASGVSTTATITLTAGAKVHIVARWDADNTLDGTNYLCLSVNDTHTFGRSSSYTPEAPSATIYVGSDSSGQNPANGIMEGLGVSRRPLWDGSYGINVGAGDEINLAHNGGSGDDPCLDSGSWGWVFFAPTNSTAEELATGTGEAWSHPHSSTILTDAWCQTTYGSSAWSTEGTRYSTGPTSGLATQRTKASSKRRQVKQLAQTT